jgi:cyclopropane fatty-acyl-phospholipid synthase-like methyltransferase
MSHKYTDIDFIKKLYSDNNRITKRGGFLKTYSQRNISIRDLVLENLNSPIDKTILDFGCGNCSFLKKIATQYPNNELYGLDINDSVMAREIENVSFNVYDGKLFPSFNFKFDSILCMNMLYHIENHSGLFKWFTTNLTDTGRILITTKSSNNFSNFNDLLFKTVSTKTGVVPEIIPDEQKFNVENSEIILKGFFSEDEYSLQHFDLQTKISVNNKSDLLNYMFSCNKYVEFANYKEDLQNKLKSHGEFEDSYTEVLWIIKNK